jgi:hypothetical protein
MIVSDAFSGYKCNGIVAMLCAPPSGGKICMTDLMIVNGIFRLARPVKYRSHVGQKLGLPSGDNNLVDFKFLGQFRKGMLAFDSFQGYLGLESRRELTT